MPIVIDYTSGGIVGGLAGNAGIYATRSDQAAQARQAQQLEMQRRSMNANIENQRQQMALRQQQQAMLERQYRDQRNDSDRQRQQQEYQAFQDSLPSTQLRKASIAAQSQQMQSQPMLDQVNRMQSQGLIDEPQAARWQGQVMGGQNPFREQTSMEQQRAGQSKATQAMQEAQQRFQIEQYRQEQQNQRHAIDVELRKLTQGGNASPAGNKEAYTRGKTLHEAKIKAATADVNLLIDQLSGDLSAMMPGSDTAARLSAEISKAQAERQKAEKEYANFLLEGYNAVAQQDAARVERAQDGLPIINSQEQYNTLPKGARYYDSAGNLREKR